MKLVILKNNLLEGLFSVEKSISESSSLPILKNILLETEDNKIKIIGTNLELAVIHYLSGKIIEEGKVCIPFSIFYNLIKNLNQDRIQLEKNKENLNIKTENYEATIYGQNPEDFPIIPKINAQEPIVIFKGLAFKEAVSRVIVSAQYSEIRPEISGLFIRYHHQLLKLVATDSFRLTEETLNQEDFQAKNGEFEVIIPLRTVQELLRIIKNENYNLELYLDPHQILFKTPEQEIISRKIDGQFPDYEAVIPKEIKDEIIIDRQEFINAIKLASLFTSRANDIVLRVGENKKFLEIFSSEGSLGENQYLVPIKLNGDRFYIAFNWRYLLDGLKIYKTNEIELGVNGSEKPAVIRSKEERNLLYILMPIKT